MVLGVLVGSVFVGFLASQTQAQKPVDYEAIAQKLVNQCASIREGDLVYVGGGVKNAELLEDIAVNVRKAGGFPLVAIDSDRMTRRMYTDVPAKYDAQSRESLAKFVESFSAFIEVSYSEDEGLLADIPPARLEANSRAGAAVTEAIIKRSPRSVYLGNGLYPTAQLAKRYGLSPDELTRIFWDAVNVDYAKLQSACESAKGRLTSGKEVRITNPNGTDLKMRIEGRPVFTSDGVISAEDEKRGYAGCQVYLPAGEVYVAPVPGTAEGKVVFDRDFIQGMEVKKLTMVFKGGKVTSMTAESGLERLKSRYDVAGAGKDEFSFVDIGVNPNFGEGPGSRFLNYVPAGMITVGIGSNIEFGGTNNCTFGYQSFLPGSTLTVDGKVLVDKGHLKY